MWPGQIGRHTQFIIRLDHYGTKTWVHQWVPVSNTNASFADCLIYSRYLTANASFAEHSIDDRYLTANALSNIGHQLMTDI